MIRTASALVAVLALVAPAAAGDPRPLFGGSKAPKIYPLSESRYIKQFAGPTVSCGACFGYYRTQWRSWAEACGEPQPIEAGPTQYTPPPEPAKEKEKPEQEKKSDPAEKKDSPKTEAPKKDPPKIEVPKIEPEKKAPKEKTSIVLPPAAVPGGFEIVVPAPAPVKPVEAATAPIPLLPVPTVIVPITGT